MTSDTTHPDLFRDADPRVFSTNADDPDSGRTFVWASAKWFERVEADEGAGAVEFSPVADSEQELREWLRESDQDIDELDADYEFAGTVREEFLEQVPLYPEASEDSDQPLDEDQTMLSPDELGDLSSSVDQSTPVSPRSQDIDTATG
jgi:hypothetical protein